MISWLNNIEFSILEKIILDEFVINMEEILSNRKKTLKYIRERLDISKSKLEKVINNIQEKLINAGNVRLCSDGGVIIKYEI